MEGNGNTALAERKASNGFLTSAMTANDVVAQVQLVQNVMGSVMKDGEHYGVIPGTKKPSLWKAGAEKLCLLFRLDAQFETVEHYDGQHLTVRSKCTLYHIPTGQRVGSGEGLCSSKEKKYAYRRDGKPNDNLPDVWNTVIKMANKRALVAATLVSTAASDIFTQDIEDMPTVLIDTQAEVKPSKKTEKPQDEERVPDSVTDATAPASEATATERPEGCFKSAVLEVREKTGKKQDGSTWTNYGVKLVDGNWVSTFSSSDADKAKKCKEGGLDCWVLTQANPKNPKYTDLTYIEPIEG